jgi:hypothetical protein
MASQRIRLVSGEIWSAVSEADGVRSTVLSILGLVAAYIGGRHVVENLSLAWLGSSVLAVVVWRLASRLSEIEHGTDASLRRFTVWGRQCVFVGRRMGVSQQTTEQDCAEWNEVVEIGVDLALGDKAWALERNKISEQIAIEHRERALRGPKTFGDAVDDMLTRRSGFEREEERLRRITSARGDRIRREADALEALLGRTSADQIHPEFMSSMLRPVPQKS